MSSYDLTANRYEGGASAGYKLDERSYIVGALRYENDDFSPFDYQAVASIGYGYTRAQEPDRRAVVRDRPRLQALSPVDSIVTSGDRRSPVRHSTMRKAKSSVAA